jgi:hypothetical protein
LKLPNQRSKLKPAIDRRYRLDEIVEESSVVRAV